MIRHFQQTQQTRSGISVVMGALLLVMLFGFTAFAVDIGYITLTRAELQKTADAAALAAVIEMHEGYGPAATITDAQVLANAQQAAADVAAQNRGGGLPAVYLEGTRDVRLGNVQWDQATGAWVETWDTPPYNLVEVTLRRDQVGSPNGDRPLDLFFAPILGNAQASVVVRSKSAMKPGSGIRKIPGVNVGVLPITIDVETWEAFINSDSIGQDNFSYNDQTGAVTSGSDGVREISIYPTGDQSLPPGNRGTVDFGHAGNSTADIKRQILYGLNDSDLEFLGGELNFDDLPMEINGDTGLSAGIKAQLEAIKGQPRLMPLFSQVSGPGNNAWYTIVKFVPIRIVEVKLTGKPSSKRVMVQPATYVAPEVVAGETVIEEDTIFAPAGLIR